MNLNEIKNLIKKTGGKYIIVENDKPEYVIMSFSEFNKTIDKREDIVSDNSIQSMVVNNNEASNSIIEGVKSPEVADVLNTHGSYSQEAKASEIKIEDLPF